MPIAKDKVMGWFKGLEIFVGLEKGSRAEGNKDTNTYRQIGRRAHLSSESQVRTSWASFAFGSHEVIHFNKGTNYKLFLFLEQNFYSARSTPSATDILVFFSGLANSESDGLSSFSGNTRLADSEPPSPISIAGYCVSS